MDIDSCIAELSRAKLHSHHAGLTLVIEVLRPGSVGGTPHVEVQSLQAGFDWDKGRVILKPEVPLTALTPQDVEAIRESVKKGESWHAFRRYSEQQDRIKALELELYEKKAEVRRLQRSSPIPYSGADEAQPLFARRWRIASDGFGLQRDDAQGNFVDIDDAVSVLHEALAAKGSPAPLPTSGTIPRAPHLGGRPPLSGAVQS